MFLVSARPRVQSHQCDEFMRSAVVKLAVKDAGPEECFYKLAEHLSHLKPGVSAGEKCAMVTVCRLAFDHYGASR